MKTLRLNIATLTIAGFFSLSANAGNFSGLEYEDYVESSVWPSHSVSMTEARSPNLSGLDYESYVESSTFNDINTSSVSQVASMDDVTSTIKKYPSAAGSSEIFVRDLFGDDIYSK